MHLTLLWGSVHFTGLWGCSSSQLQNGEIDEFDGNASSVFSATTPGNVTTMASSNYVGTVNVSVIEFKGFSGISEAEFYEMSNPLIEIGVRMVERYLEE